MTPVPPESTPRPASLAEVDHEPPTDDALYRLAGGLAGLQAVLVDFYARVFADVMIGHLFIGQDPQRLVAREAELTALLLGATDVQYAGRGMRAVHGKHPIFRGHFHRRNQLLAETLRDRAVPAPVAAAWLGHAQRMASVILGPRPAQRCEPNQPTGGGLVVVPGRPRADDAEPGSHEG